MARRLRAHGDEKRPANGPVAAYRPHEAEGAPSPYARAQWAHLAANANTPQARRYWAQKVRDADATREPRTIWVEEAITE